MIQDKRKGLLRGLPEKSSKFTTWIVRLQCGPFAPFTGKVDEIIQPQSLTKVKVKSFGRNEPLNGSDSSTTDLSAFVRLQNILLPGLEREP